jgi:hypothetical protein
MRNESREWVRVVEKPKGAVAFDSFTRTLGHAVSRRDAIRIVLRGVGSMFAAGLAGCGQLLTGRELCATPCAAGCCADGEICVADACLDRGRGISGQVGQVRFWVRSDSDYAADARYYVPGTDTTLHVVVTGSTEAAIVWEGVSIDGYGDLSAAEEQALQSLAASPLRAALWRVPLELGCHFDHLALSNYAALVFPWQLLLKYVVTERSVHLASALDDATCAYLPTLEQYHEGHPTPAVPLVQRALPFPYVFSFWPFDDEGALMPASLATGGDPSPELGAAAPEAAAEVLVHSIEPATFAVDRSGHCPPVMNRRTNEYGPHGSMCRDACGGDCPSTCCREGDHEFTCVVGSNGRYTGQLEFKETFVCGSHLGCHTHDRCYDNCQKVFGPCLRKGKPSVFCDEPRNYECHRSCDQDATKEYGYHTAAQWALGYGPKQFNIAFEYTRVASPPPALEGVCRPGECAPPGTGRRLADEDPPTDDDCPR